MKMDDRNMNYDDGLCRAKWEVSLFFYELVLSSTILCENCVIEDFEWRFGILRSAEIIAGQHQVHHINNSGNPLKIII